MPRADRLVAGRAFGDDAARAGAYAIEWLPTDFRDEILGRLGGVFRGTVVQCQVDAGLLRRRRVLAAARRRAHRPDGAGSLLRAEPDGATRVRVVQTGFEEARDGGGITK